MKVLKNLGLLLVVLVLSYLTAEYFGNWYDNFSPQYGSSFWGISRDASIEFTGSIVAYVFFTVFVYGLSGFKQNRIWISALLVPALILWFYADRYHIYLPIILGLIAFAIAKIINLIISKLRKTTPQVVEKGF